MTEPVWFCHRKGHVWLEPNNALYQRHSDRPKGLIELHCRHCGSIVSLEQSAAHTVKVISQPFGPTFGSSQKSHTRS